MEAQPGATLNPTEKVMTKLLALATALIFAATTYTSTAQAGMRVGIGIGVGGLALGALGAMSNKGGSGEAREYRSRKKERAVRREREEKAPVRAAKKSKPETTQQAAKEPVAKEPAFEASNEPSGIASKDGPAVPTVTTGSTDIAAQTENSSISLASANEAAPVKTIDTASQETKSLDCKKFFPTAGMTLSVPCE
jgi:hypothetical protein